MPINKHSLSYVARVNVIFSELEKKFPNSLKQYVHERCYVLQVIKK